MKRKDELSNGERRHSIQIQQKTKTRGADGTEIETWLALRNTRAKIVFKTGGSGEDFEGGVQLVAVQRAEIDILKQDSDIQAGAHRVQYDSEIYDILQVNPWGMGFRYLKLICEKRDND